MAIAYNSASNSGSQTAASYSYSHTCAGSDRLLIVGIGIAGNSSSNGSTVTYAGLALTLLKRETKAGGDVPKVEMWYMVDPPTGANTVAVTLTGLANSTSGAISLTGVDQSGPFGALNSATGNSTTASTSVTTTVANAWIVDVVATKNILGLTVGAGQTERWKANGGGAGLCGGSTEGPVASPAATTMSWTLSIAAYDWTIAAVEIKPQGERGYRPKPAHPVLLRDHPLANKLALAVPFHNGIGANGKVVDLVSSRNGSQVNLDSNEWTGSPYGWAASLASASSDAVNFGNIPELNTTGDLTIAAIVRPSTLPLSAVVDYSGGGAEGFSMIISGATAYFQWVNGGFVSVSLGSFWQAGEWHHVVFTYQDGGASANTVRFYSNGRLLGSGTNATDRVTSTSNNLYLGYYGAGSTDYYNGDIADVKIWTRRLSDQEIRDLNSDPFQIYRGLRGVQPTLMSSGSPEPPATALKDIIGMGYIPFGR